MDIKELTASELIVMKAIWDGDHEMALAEITKHVNEDYGKAWKPQTVSTFLAKLVSKGFIRMKRLSRSITYEVTVPQEDYKLLQARKFINFWSDGSVTGLVAALYHEKPATKEELDEMRRLIDELDK